MFTYGRVSIQLILLPKNFLTAFRPDIPSNTTFTLLTLDGGVNLQLPILAGVEANLDIQYTTGPFIPMTLRVAVLSSRNRYCDGGPYRLSVGGRQFYHCPIGHDDFPRRCCKPTNGDDDFLWRYRIVGWN
jgi:hypothetical protein